MQLMPAQEEARPSPSLVRRLAPADQRCGAMCSWRALNSIFEGTWGAVQRPWMHSPVGLTAPGARASLCFHFLFWRRTELCIERKEPGP